MEPYQRVIINRDILDISRSKKNIIRGNAMPGWVEGHVQFASGIRQTIYIPVRQCQPLSCLLCEFRL